MAKVIYAAFAEMKLKQLINSLYDEEYFGFVADAENYVHRIYDFIDRISFQRKKALLQPGPWHLVLPVSA